MLRTKFQQIVARATYDCAVGIFHPNKRVLDWYFSVVPDAYRMMKNGPARVEAIAQVIEAHVPSYASLLDVGCFEGYALHFLADRLGSNAVTGLDISEVALDRARARCAALPGTFVQIDLTALFENPDLELPPSVGTHDVVLICDMLFYVGHGCNRVWSQKTRKLQQKRALLTRLRRHARHALVVQHFSPRHRDAIGFVVESLGGRLLNRPWGIYLLEGTAAVEAENAAVCRDRA